MKPEDFKRWRKSLDLSQKEAAEALGLKRRVVQYYEKGERDGEPVKIPKYVRLACFAILTGQRDFHGLPTDADKVNLEALLATAGDAGKSAKDAREKHGKEKEAKPEKKLKAEGKAKEAKHSGEGADKGKARKKEKA